MTEMELYKPAPVDKYEGQLDTIRNTARLMLGGSVEHVEPNDLSRVAGYVLFAASEIARLRLESETDHLTGLRTRKALAGSFYEHGIFAAEQNRSFVCLFADLDKLKIVNDRRGHKAGDDYLLAATHLLQEWSGGDFETLRWGGDEFSLIGTVPYDVDADHRDNSLKALRHGLQHRVTAGLRSMCQDPEIQDIIGVTIGGVIVSPSEVREVLIVLNEGQTSIDEIVEVVHDEADKSMYADKPRDNQKVYDSIPRTSPFILPQ